MRSDMLFREACAGILDRRCSNLDLFNVDPDVVVIDEEEDNEMPEVRSRRYICLQPRAQCEVKKRKIVHSHGIFQEIRNIVDPSVLEDVLPVVATRRDVQDPNIRMEARKWKAKLEERGTSCFNPLQKDRDIKVGDCNLVAECTRTSKSFLRANDAVGPSPSFSGVGVKGLPMILGGRYQFEVELRRRSSLVVGWSVATALPSGCGVQCKGYGSNGTLVGSCARGKTIRYGKPFGEVGDVVGAFLDWTQEGPRISFALNGCFLGVAFAVHAPDHPPLQMHILQAPGPSFSVLLRGASADVPLQFPVEDYTPIGLVAKEHFCPFSVAVKTSTDVRVPTVARRLIHGSLGLQLPLSHVAQEQVVSHKQGCGTFGCGTLSHEESADDDDDCVIVSNDHESAKIKADITDRVCQRRVSIYKGGA